MDAPRLKVENANCEKVGFFIEKILSESDMYCGCQRCRLDVTALALNTLPPHYFVDAGHMNTDKIGSPWILIEMAVKESLEHVRRNPHHAQDENDIDDKIAPQKRAFG